MGAIKLFTTTTTSAIKIFAPRVIGWYSDGGGEERGVHEMLPGFWHILTLYSTTIQHKNLDFKNCNKTVEEADLQLSMINVGSVQEKIENAACA